MFTIKQASERASLNPDVLRAWERRYGVVRPHRSEAGYRLYDEADIARLEAMRELVESGWRPREAAQHVLSAGVPAGSTANGTVDEPGAPTKRRLAGPIEAAFDASSRAAREPAATFPPDLLESIERRFVRAAARLDAAALRSLLDELATLGGFEFTCEEYLFPALRALGEAWEAGEISVAGEHAASAAVQRWLGQRYDAAAREAERADVLVGLPPGAQHEMGALAFAVALRRAGADTLYLGADLPADAWAAAVAASGARLAVIGVVIDEDVAPAVQVAEALRLAAPGLEVAFGGPAARGLSAHGQTLPGRLEAAVKAAARAGRPSAARAGWRPRPR